MWVGMTTMIVVERSVRAAPGNAFQTPASQGSHLRTFPSPRAVWGSLWEAAAAAAGRRGQAASLESRNSQYLP